MDSCEQPRDGLLLHSHRPLVLPRRRRGRHIAVNLQPALRPTSRSQEEDRPELVFQEPPSEPRAVDGRILGGLAVSQRPSQEGLVK